MTATHRFRIEVTDEPGVLARVAESLGAAGANVVSIDIHEPDDGVAVDEISVLAPDGWDAMAVAAALDALTGVSVAAHRADRRVGDPVVHALTWARLMVAGDPAAHDLELTRAVLEVTGASLAWIADPDAANELSVGAAALAQGRPVVARTDDLPPTAEEIDLPAWLLAVPDDAGEPQAVAFAVRPLSIRFSRSEIARLAALMQLRRALSASVRVAD